MELYYICMFIQIILMIVICWLQMREKKTRVIESLHGFLLVIAEAFAAAFFKYARQDSFAFINFSIGVITFIVVIYLDKRYGKVDIDEISTKKEQE